MDIFKYVENILGGNKGGYMRIFKDVILFFIYIFILNIIVIQLGLVSGLKWVIAFDVVAIIIYILSIKEKQYSVLLAFSLYINFYVLVPVMIERSGSVYLYHLLSSEHKNVTQIESEMLEGYWKDGNFVQSRIKEGIDSGLIDCNSNECKLTFMGKAATNTYKFFSILLTKNPIWAHK